MPVKGAEVNDLIRHIQRAGFSVVKASRGGHYKVVRRNGTVVVDRDRPITISASPSDPNWRDAAVLQLLRADVLQADPYKATGKQKNRSGPDANGVTHNGSGAAEVFDIVRKKSDEQAAASARLRSRMEPIIVHIGGWGGKGARTIAEGVPLSSRTAVTTLEIGQVIHHWATTSDRRELPRDRMTNVPLDAATIANSAVSRLKLGHSLGRKWLPIIEAFLDELWREAGVDARLAAGRYFELLRDAKGIVVPKQPPEERPLAAVRSLPLPKPQPPTDPELEKEVAEELSGEDDVSWSSVIPPTGDVPTLALEAMYWMARGSSESNLNIAEALDLVEAIAELEIAARKK